MTRHAFLLMKIKIRIEKKKKKTRAAYEQLELVWQWHIQIRSLAYFPSCDARILNVVLKQTEFRSLG